MVDVGGSTGRATMDMDGTTLPPASEEKETWDVGGKNQQEEEKSGTMADPEKKETTRPVKRKRKVGNTVDNPTRYASGGGTNKRRIGRSKAQRIKLQKALDKPIPPKYDEWAPRWGLPTLKDIFLHETLLREPITLETIHALKTVPPEPLIEREEEEKMEKDQMEQTWTHGKMDGEDIDPGEGTNQTGENGYDGYDDARETERDELEERKEQLRNSAFLPFGLDVEFLGGGIQQESNRPRRRRVSEELERKPEVNRIPKFGDDAVREQWLSIARRDASKQLRYYNIGTRKKAQDVRRMAELTAKEVRTRAIKSARASKTVPPRLRKIVRDMVQFWKKIDKDIAEEKKKVLRMEMEMRKKEEEEREAKRQQQRLNFLLTQTELYSHFMANKMGDAAPEESKQVNEKDAKASELDEENREEEKRLEEEAKKKAEEAIAFTSQRMQEFDAHANKMRSNGGGVDLLHPSTMPSQSTVTQPKQFLGRLKPYQLKGLQWLVSLYDQGLNGILADEMGLGKTVQALSFLMHLTEAHGTWGPYLVIAPASTLPNWADEVRKFCPGLKILPYWGGIQERRVLRKNLNPKKLYTKASPFHVVVTSYQLVVQDESYFRKIKWQYMVLDEAQAIKSSSSQRWKTLLGFSCRNRLLLTGTPVQNNMAELWALLHFIMPTLFDSHEHFSEWFSKGIESHAENQTSLNDAQLKRLHGVLQPFMLRRVKKDVEEEMAKKHEVTVKCELSRRQRILYRAIKDKISVRDLFDSNAQINEKKILNLMNLIIQLRKVCNHPELFEGQVQRSSLYFREYVGPQKPPAFGTIEYVRCGTDDSKIRYVIPKLLYRDGMMRVPTSSSGSLESNPSVGLLSKFDVFSPSYIHGSWLSGGTFSFTRLMSLGSSEVAALAYADPFQAWLLSYVWKHNRQLLRYWSGAVLGKGDSDAGIISRRRALVLSPCDYPSLCRHNGSEVSTEFGTLVTKAGRRWIQASDLLHSIGGQFVAAVRAPPIKILCSDRGMVLQQEEAYNSPWMRRLLYGRETCHASLPSNAPPLLKEVCTRRLEYHYQQKPVTPCGLMEPIYRVLGASEPIQPYRLAKSLSDSGKLTALDVLLRRLKSENHRVLIFSQMTKMLNLLEDYMNFRKYRYLRLDGSNTITERRDMVSDFQNRDDIFVFLLSTRAGGLGINLTAADTVIFYESDWNPTMDLQAMDRAHRLGQTKEVTVYRLVCQNTIEEKIIKRASQKNTVQQLVMSGGESAKGDFFEPEEMVGLLLDEDEHIDPELKNKQLELAKARQQRLASRGWGARISVPKKMKINEEGDGIAMEEEGKNQGEKQPSAVVMEKKAANGPQPGSPLKKTVKRKPSAEPKQAKRKKGSAGE